MANILYNSFKRDNLNGSVNLLADTIKIMLVTSGYTANLRTHTKRSDVTNEVVGAGYTAGGVVLTNKSVTVDNVNDKAVFTADIIAIPNATITARGCVIYKSRGGAASADELVAYGDFSVDKSSSDGTFTISAPILNSL